ncbi:MAG: hypothetical protein R8M45_03715 [Ghiorsea sp.]
MLVVSKIPQVKFDLFAAIHIINSKLGNNGELRVHTTGKNIVLSVIYNGTVKIGENMEICNHIPISSNIFYDFIDLVDRIAKGVKNG